MSWVPSHDCLSLGEPAGNTRAPIDPHGFISHFRSAHVVSLTDPTLGLTRRLTQRFFIFNTGAIHLLARCDRTADQSARTTRRYL